MARILKEEEYNAKRNEILDVALSLIYSKGYVQMTIQDILDGLRISRGALYHYFDSKQAVLEALVDRMEKEAEQAIIPIVQNPNLTALQKICSYFEASAQWKDRQKELIVSLLGMWYIDENALFRQKMISKSKKGIAHFIEPIIRQGMEEKVFTTRFPEQAAEIFAGIALSLSDSMIELVLYSKCDQVAFEKLEVMLEAYADAIERILGAPSDSLKILKKDEFKAWFDTIQSEPASKEPKSEVLEGFAKKD
jgi:AcrR family transcriptional regulator